jgi:hypothetical protein
MSRPLSPARLSLAVRLIAYRGLWDKFAEPGTVGAIRRAYRRGVPCVIRAGESAPLLAELCAIAADPAINPEALPLLMADDRHRECGAWPLYVFEQAQWLRCGVYVPVRRVHRITSAELRPAIATAVPWVLVESSNVVQANEEQGILGGCSDDEILAVLMEMAPAGARLARVSDFVELDFLDRQREAA